MRSLSVSVLILLATPVAAQTYEPVLVEPVIAGTPTTMTPLNLGDDNTRQIDLGFDFTYWGQTFSSAWVGSNGTVSFSTPANLCCSGMPMEQAPRNTIFGFWTDLISYSGNPFYKRSQGSILFGWYGTQEYGTQNQYTFEISLANDNSIQFNYGSMPNLYYHYAAAGMTGPTSADNITLFYGRDPRAMQFHSGRLSWVEPEPVITVDCAVTPMDPSCPPVMVSPTPTVTVTAVETIQDAAREDAVADQSDIASITISEPAQVIDTTPTVEAQTASITEQVAAVTEQVAAAAEQSVTTKSSEQPQPERLSPDQVAALAANGSMQDVSTPLEGQMVIFGGFTQGGSSMASAAFVAGSMQSSSSMGTTSAAIETATSSSSPSSVANTLEVLNMPAPAPAMATLQGEQANTGMGAGQGDVMAAMAAVPAFAAYTQVSLQDRPDFYAIRDIYRNRRLRDANFEMYRMTRTSGDKWSEMVDEQYGR